MIKLERQIPQADGSEVKLVGQTIASIGPEFDTDIYALHRDNADTPWRVLSDQPHPDWKTMSVDEYDKRGRSELLQRVGHGPILAMSQELRIREEARMANEIEAIKGELINSDRPRG